MRFLDRPTADKDTICRKKNADFKNRDRQREGEKDFKTTTKKDF